MEQEKKKIVFQKLTPVHDIDMSVYEDAMQYVFSNDDIRNVAISGSYGAGKSSLLETYKRNHREKVFLSISLAHFKKSEDEPEDIGTKLEGKIINQLVQQIKEENVPLTNFCVKREADREKASAITRRIVVFIALIVFIFNYSKTVKWVESLADSFLKSILQFICHPYVFLFAIGALGFLFASGIYYVVSYQKSKNIFRRLSFQGAEIEIFEEDKAEYFDRYLNEVLYLFENSNVDAIVFEDIDRFDNIHVFERLREINVLANIRLAQSGSKRVLRFFYLMRDDIFLGKERTKFFDYILPVIPVVDNSNSYNKLREYFGQSGILEKFDDKFLRELALYIDDMRILKNIYNEFMIYFYRLEAIGLDYNKMLAIITYKNIFPKDYSNLQLNRGFVRDLFRQREDIIEEKIRIYKEEISKLKERMLEISGEHLETLQELEDVRVARKSRYNNTSERREEFKKWEQEAYVRRKQIIENILTGEIAECEDRIAQLQYEIEHVSGKVLSELLGEGTYREVVDKYFICEKMKKTLNFSEIVKDNYFDLLVFLVRHGYLDETYSDYMTYFYPNSLTVRDKKFLRCISDKMPVPYSYKLDSTVLVIENLNVLDFEKEEVLNFDLLSALLQGKGEWEYLDKFIRQLKGGNAWGFVSHFFRQCNEKKEFFAALSLSWPEFFHDAIKTNSISMQQIDEICIDLLKYTELENLGKINIEGCLTEYISNHAKGLFELDGCGEILNEKVTLLGIQFKVLPNDIKNVSLFDHVYLNHLYEINTNNILVILNRKYLISDEKKILSELISFIFDKKEEPIYECFLNSINDFMEMLIGENIENFTDRNDVVITLLNDESIESKNVLSYISRMKTIVEAVVEVKNPEYMKELLRNGRVKYSSENVWEYFSIHGLSAELIEFINNHDTELNFSWTSELDNSQRSAFWNACISCGDLTDKKYSEIMSTMGYCYKSFGIKGIPDNKLMILVNKGIIYMTEQSLEFIRNNYPDCVLGYIKRNPQEYVEIAKGEVASSEEVTEILKWESFDDETKIQLLSEIEDEIAITDMNYSEEVMLHILDNNFSLDDLPGLCETYEIYPSTVKEILVKISEEHIEEVIENGNRIDKSLLIELLSKESIDLMARVNLLIQNMEKLTRKECVNCLKLVNANEIVKLFDKHARPRIPVNKLNQLIMVSLKGNGYIKDFAIDKGRGIYKYARGKRILSIT